MLPSPMSTLQEGDTPNGDYFDRELPSSSAGVHEPAVQTDQDESARSAEAPHSAPEQVPTDMGSELQSAPQESSSSLAPPKTGSADRLMAHKASASGLSEASFYSAISDTESSDRRSGSTDTNPTTAEGGDDGKDPSQGDARSSEDDPISDLPRIGMHRNESQTTIRREGSAGSDITSRNGAKVANKPVAAPLPTHHESPSSPEQEPGEASQPAPSLSALVKRNSQSSQGHTRTPSRTKRRSISSTLSDHMPPALDARPLDYVALLTQFEPPTFSSELEQNLLSQLSTLGLDVGQIVHSIVTDACDASGALWWMLKRKTEEREAMEPPTPVAPTPTIGPPPPLPPKDPARKSVDQSKDVRPTVSPSVSAPVLPSAIIARDSEAQSSRRSSQSETPNDPLSSSPAIASTSMTSLDRGSSGTPDSSTGRQSKNRMAVTSSPAQRSTSSAHSHDSRAKRQAERQRSSSVSMLQRATTVLAGGNREKKDTAELMRVDTNNATIDRARIPSPVSSIFGKRSTSSIISQMSSRDAPMPKSDGGIDASRKMDKTKGRTPEEKVLQASKTASTGDKDLNRVKSLASLDGTNTSPVRPSGKSKAHDRSSGSPRKPSPDGMSQTTPSASFDTLSSLGASYGSGSNDMGKTAKSRSRSSFLATVRTWLGSDEKQQRKRTKSKGAKGLPSSLGHDGPGSASQAIVRNGSVRNRSGAYANGSIGRRGPVSPRRASMSRRSSASSAHMMSLVDGASRPSNLRRQSAGSITPTATVYGDYAHEHSHTLPGQHPSRPNSSHSHGRSAGGLGAKRASLHGKSGSTSSSSSFMRMQQLDARGQGASSLRGRHGRRTSSDGGTQVRRHRTYGALHSPHGSQSRRPSRAGSTHSRCSSRADSHDGDLATPTNESIGTKDIAEASEEEEDEPTIDAHPTEASRRTSMDSRGSASRALVESKGRNSPLTIKTDHPNQAHSIFVAHKSRSPYKPPSANPLLYGSLVRASSHSPVPSASASGEPPAAGTGTWRRSWGRPPPSWAGAVDMTPSRADMVDAAVRPKLRDVFAAREGDDEWVDEDEEPSYSGGLGQFDSLTSAWGAAATSAAAPVSSGPFDSPFGTRPLAMGSNPASMGMLGAGRYAGVRSLFTAPSLGSDVTPRVLGTTAEDEPSASTTPTSNGAASSEARPANSRVRSAAQRTFKGNIIEEEEENE